MIFLFLVNLLTNASITLLLAVAPPAHNSPRILYEDTFAHHVPLLMVNVPELNGRHLRKAAFQNRNKLISAGTCSKDNRPPSPGSLSATIARHRSIVGPPIGLKPPRAKLQQNVFSIDCNCAASISGGNRDFNL